MDQLERLHPCPARRSTIGGLYDHRPVAPRSPVHGFFRSPGSIQRTDPGRNRFETTRPRSAYPHRRFGPDPSALPRDGDGFDCARGFNADHTVTCKSRKPLKSLGSIPDTPSMERRERSYWPPSRWRAPPPEGEEGSRPPPLGGERPRGAWSGGGLRRRPTLPPRHFSAPPVESAGAGASLGLKRRDGRGLNGRHRHAIRPASL